MTQKGPTKLNSSPKTTSAPALKGRDLRKTTAPAIAPTKSPENQAPLKQAAQKPLALKQNAATRSERPRATPLLSPAASPTPSRSRSASRSATSTVDRKNEPLSQFTLANVSHDTRVAPNFVVYELTRSELANRRGIDNHFPTDKELRAAIHLARNVLQPVRAAFGSFTPNSVYRGQALERALKNKPATWISTSQHARGEACDIEIVGKPTLELAIWARDHLAEFDQIICECYDPRKGPNSGWVHISLKPPGSGPNRRQCLSYVVDKASGKLVYVQGLRAEN